jgi:hypothetical protein
MPVDAVATESSLVFSSPDHRRGVQHGRAAGGGGRVRSAMLAAPLPVELGVWYLRLGPRLCGGGARDPCGPITRWLQRGVTVTPAPEAL